MTAPTGGTPPNATELLHRLRRMAAMPGEEGFDQITFLDVFEDLDSYLSTGGRLPSDWSMAPVAPRDALLAEIAAMHMDGELVDGEPYCVENDAAVTTLNGLIEEARRLPQDPPPGDPGGDPTLVMGGVVMERACTRTKGRYRSSRSRRVHMIEHPRWTEWWAAHPVTDPAIQEAFLKLPEVTHEDDGAPRDEVGRLLPTEITCPDCLGRGAVLTAEGRALQARLNRR
jgi:hypothetical protein